VRASLDEAVIEGRLARWEILRMLEKNLEWNFRHAVASVTREMGLDKGVLDPIVGESLRNSILWGRDGEPESLALALIRRCLSKEPFTRVDPELYVRRWMYSTSESAVRRYIGDPHIGRRIRALARELGTQDQETVLREFNRRHPHENVGTRRVADAMSAQQRLFGLVSQLTLAGNESSLDDASSRRFGVGR
jgi:hypothetical protein